MQQQQENRITAATTHKTIGVGSTPQLDQVLKYNKQQPSRLSWEKSVLHKTGPDLVKSKTKGKEAASSFCLSELSGKKKFFSSFLFPKI